MWLRGVPERVAMTIAGHLTRFQGNRQEVLPRK
jgi:hypothetical protein